MKKDINSNSAECASSKNSTLINLCGCLFRGSLVRQDADNWVLEFRSALDSFPLTVADVDVRLSNASREQFVALSRPGIARQLARPPVLSQRNDTIRVDVVVRPPLPRCSAHAIPPQIVDIAEERMTPGGAKDIALRLEQSLSTSRGSHAYDPDWGSSHRADVARHGQAWLADFIALEIARSAFIPTVTLDFVRSVREVNLPDDLTEGSSTHADIVLDVEGEGEWTGKVKIVLE